jgi:succinate-semialdehyde dehydrogenase
MSSSHFATTNPATDEQIEEFAYFTPQETETVIARAEKGFKSYSRLPIFERAKLLSNLADSLRRNKEQLAKVITMEMGKILTEAEAEVEKCAWEADWYAEHGPQMLADAPAPTGGVEAYVSFHPLGLILGIMPWNFPLWQATRMGIPTLLAGNVILIKHSPNTQRSSLELERVMLEAGYPEGVLQNLILKTEDIVNVINDDRVQGVSVTGSVRAGSAVASEAGKVIKKTVLELGGSDAFIVLEDADIPRAVAAGIKGRFTNAGQICLAAKRFILTEKVAEAFEEQFVIAAQTIKVGDPMNRATQVGPLARKDLRDSLHQQVQSSLSAGAILLCGGAPCAGKGAFYPTTVLSEVKPGMAVFDEETFGPVAAMIRVPDADAAIKAANQSEFGLSGNIWTRDVALARRMAREMCTGGVFINGVSASDPRVPVGGVKKSGYGRELSSLGPHAFVNAQTVWIQNS